MSEARKEYLKQYKAKNKEIIKVKRKAYYEANKTGIQEYRQVNYIKICRQRSKKITCSCGLIYTYGHKNEHSNTDIHKKRMMFPFLFALPITYEA